LRCIDDAGGDITKDSTWQRGTEPADSDDFDKHIFLVKQHLAEAYLFVESRTEQLLKKGILG